MRVLELLLLLVSLSLPVAAVADTGHQVFLDQLLAEVRAKDQLPAAAVMIQIDGKTVASSAQGLRAIGHPDKVSLQDPWELGSDTKAITATMIARLVDKGLLRFEDRLQDLLPDLATTMDPAYRSVTLVQLLGHTGGLPPLTDDADLPEFKRVIATAKGVQAQRQAIAGAYLAKPPASPIGEFSYSNIGYIVAGAIAERRTGKSWESLVRREVFKPLGIHQGGFGTPGHAKKIDAPWGHKESGGKLVALNPNDPEGQDPLAIGPAGTIHMTLADWMLFAQDQLDGAHGRGRLLSPETYRILHTPVSEHYALGWGVKLDDQGKPLLLTHSGSNGYWIADVRIMPKHNIIILFVSNLGSEAANRAILDLGKPLRDRLKPFD
ncbi:serine hydrolase domain-containing protein [Aquisediminimonas profunda]|uniref:serine hydrolase domain-containing protein n=1 Tax=Aquisediminimonas profunda TaxID=1550733 RepID=UPI001C63ABC2|nr:serine hydrolase domain-containing protein [Aquisediminimonas profunda]